MECENSSKSSKSFLIFDCKSSKIHQNPSICRNLGSKINSDRLDSDIKKDISPIFAFNLVENQPENPLNRPISNSGNIKQWKIVEKQRNFSHVKTTMEQNDEIWLALRWSLDWSFLYLNSLNIWVDWKSSNDNEIRLQTVNNPLDSNIKTMEQNNEIWLVDRWSLDWLFHYLNCVLASQTKRWVFLWIFFFLYLFLLTAGDRARGWGASSSGGKRKHSGFRMGIPHLPPLSRVSTRFQNDVFIFFVNFSISTQTPRNYSNLFIWPLPIDLINSVVVNLILSYS